MVLTWVYKSDLTTKTANRFDLASIYPHQGEATYLLPHWNFI